MASTARAVATAARALPAREPASSRPADAGAARPRLDVVDRRRAAARSDHRRANMLRGLGVMFVVGALAVTAAAHTFVASDQQRIDTLQGQLTQALAQQQDLQLSRAELESPVRVLAIAERQLGMISPESVSYLAPVDPGPSVSQAGADAARAALAAAAAALKAGLAKSAGPARSTTSNSLAVKTRTRTSLAGARSSAVTPPTR
jgi:cell division protein FtsL